MPEIESAPLSPSLFLSLPLPPSISLHLPPSLSPSMLRKVPRPPSLALRAAVWGGTDTLAREAEPVAALLLLKALKPRCGTCASLVCVCVCSVPRRCVCVCVCVNFCV